MDEPRGKTVCQLAGSRGPGMVDGGEPGLANPWGEDLEHGAMVLVVEGAVEEIGRLEIGQGLEIGDEGSLGIGVVGDVEQHGAWQPVEPLEPPRPTATFETSGDGATVEPIEARRPQMLDQPHRQGSIVTLMGPR